MQTIATPANFATQPFLLLIVKFDYLVRKVLGCVHFTLQPVDSIGDCGFVAAMSTTCYVELNLVKD